MKREKSLKWKKISGGSFSAIINGERKIIKKNEIFKAKETEVPIAFRDQIICLSKRVEEKEVDSVDGVATPAYKKKSIGEEDLFDVVDKKGEVQNEEPLTEEEADKLIAALEE